MPDNAYKKLELFTKAIVGDAQEESRRIYEAIQQESEQIMAAAEDEALAEAFRYIKREVAQIQNRSGQVVSRRIMEQKTALARRRDEMSAETLLLVREKLEDYVHSEAYRRQLQKLAREAVEAFNADTLIYLRPEDMPLADSLRPGNTAVSVSFEPGSFRLGGLQAVCRSRGLEIDESFDTTLAELSGHFAELFGLALNN